MIGLLLAAPLALALAPPPADPPGDGKVALNPFVSRILTAPARPRVLPTEHPLAHRVAIAGIAGIPARIGPWVNGIARGRDVEAAIGEALAASAMGAPDAASAKARLSVQWLGIDAPLKIGTSARATVRMRWTLTRVDSGQVIFARDIATSGAFSGGNAVDRFKGTGRAAILANIASALWCIDRAATGEAPADCALSPVGSFDAPMPSVRVIYMPR